MERRSFIKNTGIMTTAVLLFSESAVLATAGNKESKPVANFSNKLSSAKPFQIKGMFLDSETKAPIPATIEVKIFKTKLLSNKKTIVSTDGNYLLNSRMLNSGKISEKVHFEVTAKGYKTYKGTVYVTVKGCNIHSDAWTYNPNFKPEFAPKNKNKETILESTFNFYLVKA